MPLLSLSPKRADHARKLLNWTRGDLALRSGLSERMLQEWEAGSLALRQARSVALAVRAALEGAGVEVTTPKSRLGNVRTERDAPGAGANAT